MRQTCRLRQLGGLGVDVCRPCLLPVQASRVKRVGERGRAHLAVGPRSALEVAVGLLVAVPWSMSA